MATKTKETVRADQGVGDGEKLPPQLERAQHLAALPDPKPVPLVRQKADKDGPDPGPPQPPTAKPTPVPRVIHQNERAPAGLKRYKVRCANYGDGQPQKYILCNSEDEAKQHYLRASGLQAVLDLLGSNAEPPVLIVRVMPD